MTLQPLKKAPSAETLTDIYIVVMLLVFPLFTGFEGYLQITLSKFIFFAAATGLWLLGLIVFAAVRRPRLSRPRPVQLLALCFMLVCCLSALLSPYDVSPLRGSGRCDGLLSLLLYGAVFLGVSQTGRPKPVHFWALTISCALCCLVGALQLMGRNPLGLYPYGWNYYDGNMLYTGEFLGTIGNVGLLSRYLCLCVPLLFLCFLRSPRKNYPMLATSLAGLALLLLSGAASGPVALGICVLASLPLLCKRRRLWFIVSCSAALVVLLLIYLLPPESGSLNELSRLLHGNIDDSFGSSRIGIWRNTLALFPERPLLGGGAGTLRQRLGMSFSRYIPETGLTRTVAVDNAHNEYLALLSDVGILGLGVYLAGMLLTLVRVFRRPQVYSGLFGCCLICCWAQAFFDVGLCFTIPMVMIIWGLCECSVTTTEAGGQ